MSAINGSISREITGSQEILPPGNDFLSAVKEVYGGLSSALKVDAFTCGFFGAAFIVGGTIGIYLTAIAPAANAKQLETKRFYQVLSYASIAAGLMFAMFSYRFNALANDCNALANDCNALANDCNALANEFSKLS